MEVSFKPGDTIVTQGDVGDAFYIVKEGVVECLVNNKLVKTVSTGGYFGERALLRDEPRAADCIARGNCVCVALKREDFVAMLGPLGPILDHNMIKDTVSTRAREHASWGSVARQLMAVAWQLGSVARAWRSSRGLHDVTDVTGVTRPGRSSRVCNVCDACDVPLP